MKTTNIKLLFFAIAACFSLLSCEKEVINTDPPPSPQPPPPTMYFVTYSGWFDINLDSATLQEDRQFTKTAPQLTGDLLMNGRLLVFGKGGHELKDPTILPSFFDGNWLVETAQPGSIKFIMEGAGLISRSLEFRFIFIPSRQIVAGKLDYSDYNAVCNYYKIIK